MSDRHVTAARLRMGAILLPLLALAAPVAAELRDPLRPPAQGAASAEQPAIDPADWRLASTLIADGRRVAVINGQIAAPGHTVDGARVLAVERGRARLRVGEEEFMIQTSKPSIRSSDGEEPQP